MLTRIFLFLIGVAASTASSAAILSYDYTASNDAKGITLAGTFGYDNSAGDDSSSDPNLGEYTAAGFWTGVVSNGPHDGYTFNLSNLDIEVYNDDLDFADYFTMFSSSSPQTYIDLIDEDQTVFSDDSLPALLTLDDFEIFEMSIVGDADSGILLYFDIDTISAPTIVPLPPAIWLFGSALLGLVGWSRGKKTI